ASLPEVGGEACLYLESPSDPGEMALAMRRLAQDAALQDGMRLRGLEQAARFRWGDSADAAVAAYFKSAT
ncbi:MAG: glycosyltransferase family 1 protein, partial [Acidobacteriota bacterium]